MIFRTQIQIPPSLQKISYHSKCLLTGSCFTENMGSYLQKLKFPSKVNPFGILYNPMSIGSSLQRLLTQKPFIENELHFHNEQWHSFAHHGKFSHSDKEVCLKRINQELEEASDFLQKADFLFLTLGTAFVYEWKESRQIVANCHKIPQKQFHYYKVSVEQIVETLTPLLEGIQAVNPKLQIVFTLSPIRHWKNGAVDNQLSKATLLVAIHELREKLENIHYFPAYELMMDDLRDYRFYESDMLHPNSTAIDYIWQQFRSVYFDGLTEKTMARVQKISNAQNHRPRNPTSAAHQRFLRQRLEQIGDLETMFPFLDFTEERAFFASHLLTQ